MPQKTFNIGESSYYGRWKIIIKGNAITVQGIDWDTRKVERTDTFSTADIGNHGLEMHLSDMSTCYFAGEMMKWVRSKVDIKDQGGHGCVSQRF